MGRRADTQLSLDFAIAIWLLARSVPDVEPLQFPAGVMYYEFHARFGGACRTRHIEPDRVGWRRVQRFFSRFLPLADPKKRWKREQTLRVHRLSRGTELPQRFIGLDPWEAEYLYAIASRARHGIVEIGRRNGGSVFLMAHANDRVPIHSIDIGPADDGRLRGLLAKHGIGRNVELIVADSQREPFCQIAHCDVLFVDGDHSYEGCSRDLENFAARLLPGGHIVLHDCFFGCAVQDAVLDFLARHPEFEPVLSPYTPASHWHQPHGSLAHLRKLSERTSGDVAKIGSIGLARIERLPAA